MKDIYERHPSNTQYNYQKIYIIYRTWEKAARVARAKFQKLPPIRWYGDSQESSTPKHRASLLVWVRHTYS